MKKTFILLFSAVCLLQINGFSQKKPTARVGLTGGLSFSNISGHIDDKDVHHDSRKGFTVGLIVDAPICKSRFSFQPGVHYAQKGMFTLKTADLKQAVALRYAEFLLNFVYNTRMKGKAPHFFFGLGPAIEFSLPSKKVTITDDRTYSSIKFGKESTDDYRGFDYGANGMIGLACHNGLFLAVNYTYGLFNLLPERTGNDVLRNGYAAIRLGYLFNNK